MDEFWNREALPMTRFARSLLLVLVAFTLAATPAMAGRAWCARDPIVRINGAEVQVWVAIPADVEPLVNGPIEMLVKSPAGATREIVFTDEGFNGHGEVVTFRDSPQAVADNGTFTVNIRVIVPVDQAELVAVTGRKKLPVRLTIIDGGRKKTVSGLSGGTWTSATITPAVSIRGGK
jgi:hypothetical protein